MGGQSSKEGDYAYYERYAPGEVFAEVKESCIVHPPSRLRDELRRGILWSVTHPVKKAVRDLQPYASSLADWSSNSSVVGLRDLSSVRERLKVIVRLDGGMMRIFAPEDAFHGGSTVEELLRTQLHDVHVDWYKREDVLREIFPSER